MDFLLLIIFALLGIGSCYIALKDRSMIAYFISGIIWFSFSMYVFMQNLNPMLGICELGIALYMFIGMITL